MKKINAELNSWNESFDLENIPKDASEFSFWVAGVLPLDDATKLELLQTDCAVQRMMSELKLMKRVRFILCIISIYIYQCHLYQLFNYYKNYILKLFYSVNNIRRLLVLF